MSRNVLFAVLLGSALALPAAGQPCNVILGCPIVIDDFDSGALPPANGPFEFTHVGLPPQSCVGGSRRVWINEVASHSAGMIVTGGNDIVFQIQTEEHSPPGDVFTGADVILDYVMNQTIDLTAGGANDRFTIDVISAYLSSVFVYFSYPGGAIGTTIILQQGSNSILFSQLPVALTQVEQITLYFHSTSTNGVSELTINRIRATGNGLKYLLLDLPTLVDMNPLPSMGPVIRSVYPNDMGKFVESLHLQMTAEFAQLLNPNPGQPSAVPVEIHSSDSGPGQEFGAMAGFEFIEGVAFKADHGDVEFLLSIALEANGGVYPSEIIMSDMAEIPNKKEFYVPFEVRLLTAAGDQAGSLFYRMRVNVPEGVAYEIQQARLDPAMGFGDYDFQFSFELHDDGTRGKAAGQQLFNVSIEADYAEVSGSVVAAPTRSAGNGLSLSATPTVVSDRTTLHLNRSLDRPASLRIYDLAGRLVRNLLVPQGQQLVPWNTTDDRGISVASGVYVAHLSAGARSATSKIVVVR